jgi:protein-disulfide isomerase
MKLQWQTWDQRGSAVPLSLLLGTALIVLPVVVLVLTLPTWEQRAVDAQDAARTAARALVTADDWGDGVSAADEAVTQLVAGDGLPPTDLSVSYSGSFVPGGSVTAAVTVVIPAGNLPGLGFVGQLHYTASSTDHVDSYRDSST